MCAYEPLGPFVPLASHRTCWVVSRVSNGSSWLLTALFIPNEKAIRRRYGPPEQTNAWISLQQGTTLWTQSIGNGITSLHLRWRQKNDVSRKLQHGCSIAFSFPSSNDAQMLVISPFFRVPTELLRLWLMRSLVWSAPLVQTARLRGVVRNFKHTVVCQNSREKI